MTYKHDVVPKDYVLFDKVINHPTIPKEPVFIIPTKIEKIVQSSSSSSGTKSVYTEEGTFDEAAQDIRIKLIQEEIKVKMSKAQKKRLKKKNKDKNQEDVEMSD